jgi:hypothetical protein
MAPPQLCHPERSAAESKDLRLLFAIVFSKIGTAADRIRGKMKIPSMDLETKVLLTAVAICIYGSLRMTHVIHLSDRQDISFLFVIAFALAVLVLRKDRNSSACSAVYFLSFGLCFWSLTAPDKSIVGVLFKWLFVVISGGGLLNSALSALKDLRQSKKKARPEISGVD